MFSAGYQPVTINSRIETEEVLGPLPDDWEVAVWGSRERKLFVNHATKTATWIDPRTRPLRKHDIREVVPGELPYGWEEAFDNVFGVYFIDHLSQQNFSDPPWDAAVQKIIINNDDRLVLATKAIEEQLNLDERLMAEINQEAEKLEQLENARLRLERDLLKLHHKQDDDGANAVLEEEEDRLREELFDLQQEIDQEQINLEMVAETGHEIEIEILEYKNRLNELRQANEKLEDENIDFMEETAAANVEIEEMRAMINAEATQRAALEAYIKTLKVEVIEMFDPSMAEHVKNVDTLNDYENDNDDAPLPESTNNTQLELLALRARLQDEREERRRLKELTETLESERNRIQENILNDELVEYLPEWILDLNVKAEKSKTLRRRIKETDPDTLGFREKILKFTAAAIDADEKPKAPTSPANARKKKAVKGKETAFAASPASSTYSVDDELDKSFIAAAGSSSTAPAEFKKGNILDRFMTEPIDMEDQSRPNTSGGFRPKTPVLVQKATTLKSKVLTNRVSSRGSTRQISSDALSNVSDFEPTSPLLRRKGSMTDKGTAASQKKLSVTAAPTKSAGKQIKKADPAIMKRISSVSSTGASIRSRSNSVTTTAFDSSKVKKAPPLSQQPAGRKRAASSSSVAEELENNPYVQELRRSQSSLASKRSSSTSSAISMEKNSLPRTHKSKGTKATTTPTTATLARAPLISTTTRPAAKATTTSGNRSRTASTSVKRSSSVGATETRSRSRASSTTNAYNSSASNTLKRNGSVQAKARASSTTPAVVSSKKNAIVDNSTRSRTASTSSMTAKNHTTRSRTGSAGSLGRTGAKISSSKTSDAPAVIKRESVMQKIEEKALKPVGDGGVKPRTSSVRKRSNSTTSTASVYGTIKKKPIKK